MKQFDNATLERMVASDRRMLVQELAHIGTDQDVDGTATELAAGTLQFLACADYLLGLDAIAFRRQLAQGMELRLSLFARYDRHPGAEGKLIGPFNSIEEALAVGRAAARESALSAERDAVGTLVDRIDPSFATMVSFDVMLNALATGDLALTRRAATIIGGRPEAEKHDGPTVRVMGYTLKHCILQNRKELRGWAAQFPALCRKRGNKSLIGYSNAFVGLSQGDAELVSQGFVQMKTSFSQLYGVCGKWSGSRNRFVPIWHIGMVHLARLIYGMDPKLPPGFAPEDLLLRKPLG